MLYNDKGKKYAYAVAGQQMLSICLGNGLDAAEGLDGLILSAHLGDLEILQVLLMIFLREGLQGMQIGRQVIVAKFITLIIYLPPATEQGGMILKAQEGHSGERGLRLTRVLENQDQKLMIGAS